jgi:hypothetical protein
MKKLLLLLIVLTTFMNVSYASFPVVDTLEAKVDSLQTEEIKQYHYSLQQMGIDLKSCKCESCRNGIAPLLSKPKPLPIKTENVKEVEKREPNGNSYAFLSIISALGSIFLFFLTLVSSAIPPYSDNAPTIYLLLTLLSIGLTIFSTIQAKKKGASWSKSFLGVGVAVLAILLILILVA